MRNRIKNYCVQPKLGAVGLHQGKCLCLWTVLSWISSPWWIVLFIVIIIILLLLLIILLLLLSLLPLPLGVDAVLCSIQNPSAKNVPIEQLINVQKLRPGSGMLLVKVLADGPTRTVRIADVQQEVWSSILFYFSLIILILSVFFNLNFPTKVRRIGVPYSKLPFFLYFYVERPRRTFWQRLDGCWRSWSLKTDHTCWLHTRSN